MKVPNSDLQPSGSHVGFFLPFGRHNSRQLGRVPFAFFLPFGGHVIAPMEQDSAYSIPSLRLQSAHRPVPFVVQAREGPMVARTVVAPRLPIPHRARRLAVLCPEVQP